jgi:CubicO group peptidase (beta-lactamase class C family)
MKWSGTVALLVLTLGAQDNRAPAAADITAHIEAELKAARVPGAAVAVVAGDQRLARGYGIAAADIGVPVDANTDVHTGSLTKLFTALAVIRALELRDLSADDAAVGAYVRGLHQRTARATFHHLLSQTSGLRDRAGNDGPSSETALGDAARELGPADFLLPPGTVFSYSNLGYALAGAALEGLHQRPDADAMRELLFQPLGMTRSTIRPSVATAGAHAVGHRLDGDRATVVRPMANDADLACRLHVVERQRTCPVRCSRSSITAGLTTRT